MQKERAGGTEVLYHVYVIHVERKSYTLKEKVTQDTAEQNLCAVAQTKFNLSLN